MSAKEQAIKRLLVDQLKNNPVVGSIWWGPSYAEKKHIIEQLDGDYIEEEIQRLRKHGRKLAIVFGSVYSVLVTFMVVSTVVSGSVTAAYMDGVFDMLMLVAGLAASFVMYAAYKARLFMFETLRVLAGTENQAAQRLAGRSQVTTVG